MIKITDRKEFYNEIKGETLVVADFAAAWCAPCKMQSPILSEFEKNLDGKVKILKVDVDENAELADELNVTAVPSLFIYKNGEFIDKIVGLTTKAVLAEKLIAYV